MRGRVLSHFSLWPGDLGNSQAVGSTFQVCRRLTPVRKWLEESYLAWYQYIHHQPDVI